jgi:hypothetical protein
MATERVPDDEVGRVLRLPKSPHHGPRPNSEMGSAGMEVGSVFLHGGYLRDLGPYLMPK